jgi:uncharacterized protein (TIGR02246 family)
MESKEPSVRTRILAATLLAALGLSFAAALAQRPGTPTSDEDALRQTLDAYVAAYNKGELETIMSFWADGAEFVDESGAVTRGKDAITALFRKAMAEHKGRTIRVQVRPPRLLRPDFALQDGTTEVKAPDGFSDQSPFAAAWTKASGKWQILSVRDLPGATEAEPNTSADQLRQLEWLIGDWAYQDKDTAIKLSCRRTQKRSFLLLEQSVRIKGEEVLSLIQVIGWDPLQQQFRSWVFDSAGGFGNGLWERQGNEWILAVEGVRSDGRQASGTNSWRFVDDSTFEWAATDREIDGEPAPDQQVRYTRQAEKK